MSGAHRMILCTLALLSGSMALTAKESPGKTAEPKVSVSPDGFVDTVTATNGVTTATTTAAPVPAANMMMNKVTATVGVTAAATTAAPAAKVDPPPDVKAQASASIVGKAAAVVGTALSAATSLAAATITCPDGFANAAAGSKCCDSQFVKHFDKAKLLCESEPGWKTFQASPSSFNCCQVSTAVAPPVAPAPAPYKAPAPVKAPVVTQAAVVKQPEVTPAPLSTLKKASLPPSAPTHSPGFNSAAHLEQVKKPHLPPAVDPVTDIAGDGMEPNMDMDEETKRMMQDAMMMNEFDRSTTMSPMHRDHQQQHASSGNSHQVLHAPYEKHHRHREASHFAHQPKYDDIIMGTMDSQSDPRFPSAGWETWHYMVLAVLVMALWLNMPSGDMRKVPVPGYGDVDFMGEKNPEKCDLFSSGYTPNSYGGAATKQPVAMKNPAGDYRFNNFNDDDIGL